MLPVNETNRFRRDLKLALRRGKNLEKLKAIVKLLAQQKSLPPRHRDHNLTGDWSGYRECHIEPDWLLIYDVHDGALWLNRTGTHADLFR